MKTIIIKDLSCNDAADANARVRSLSPEEMKQVRGGRAMRVLVDGTSNATVDDFALNMDIFKGNIGGPMVV